MTPAEFGDSSVYASVGNNMPSARHRPKPDTSLWHEADVGPGIVQCHLIQVVLSDNKITLHSCTRRWQRPRWTRW